ncbi:MAG: glycosyltransferase [Planctomycetota bacterium]
MTSLSLGVVIPTLNAAATLCETLLTLRSARAMGARVVVVDGGSIDGSIEIAQREGVEVLSHDGGMYAALNAGFRDIDTEWLTWINADDLLYADVLRAQLAYAGKAAAVYGVVDFVDEAGRFMHSWTSAAPDELLRLYRAGYSPLLQQGTLFRRHLYHAVEGFSEQYRLVADADFWWRALEQGFDFVRTTHPPVAGFRLHINQLSQRYAAVMQKEHQRMVAAHGGRRRTARSYWALCKYRGRNLPAYIVRAIRRRDLEGDLRLCSSYDVVEHRAPRRV